MHVIQISHRRSDPHHCRHAFSSIESWLDSATWSFLPSMVAAHTHHRGRLDVSPTIIVSALVFTVRADHLTSRSTWTPRQRRCTPSARRRLAWFVRRGGISNEEANMSKDLI